LPLACVLLAVAGRVGCLWTLVEGGVLDSGSSRVPGFQPTRGRGGGLGPRLLCVTVGRTTAAGWQGGSWASPLCRCFFGRNVERDGDTSRTWSGRLSLLASRLHVARGVVLLLGGCGYRD
jgi:hypothetical protein